jgi:hypothetical protein
MPLSWSERAKQSSGLPNLGFGGTLVAAFVTSFFAAQIGDALFVMLIFGPHAFFDEGLRVANWKHGTLSNGTALPFKTDFIRGLMTFAFWMLLIGSCELVAGFVTAFLKRRAPWISGVFRLVGGAILLAFSCWFSAHNFSFMHPIPLSSFFGGIVLVWKGVVNTLRQDQLKSDV